MYNFVKCMIIFCVSAISNGTILCTWSGVEEDDQRQKENQIIIAAKIVDKLIIRTVQVKLSLTCVLWLGKGRGYRKTYLCWSLLSIFCSKRSRWHSHPSTKWVAERKGGNMLVLHHLTELPQGSRGMEWCVLCLYASWTMDEGRRDSFLLSDDMFVP